MSNHTFKPGQQVRCISENFPYIPEYGGTNAAVDKPKLFEVLEIEDVLGDFLTFAKYNEEDATNWFKYDRFAAIDDPKNLLNRKVKDHLVSKFN